MICPPCRRGGELNDDAGRVTDAVTAEWIATRAIEAHGECWAPNTCPCHHKTGSGRINPEASKR